MKRLVLLLLITMPAILFTANVFGQENAQTDSLKKEPTVIPISQITSRATKLNSTLLEQGSKRISPARKKEIRSSVDTLLFRLNLLREDPRIQNISTLSLRSIEDLELTWNGLRSHFNNQQNQLVSRVDEIENNRSRLSETKNLWMRTKELSINNNAPESVISQIEETLSELGSMLESLRMDSEFFQDQLVKISNGLIFCNTLIDELNTAKDQVTKKLLELNEPPLWKLFNTKSDSIILQTRRSHLDDITAEVKQFARSNSLRLILHIILLIIIFISVRALFKSIRSRLTESDDKELDTIKKITLRPYSSSLLTGFLLTYILYSTIPSSVLFINTLILLVPVFIILSDLIGITSRRYILPPLVALVIIQVHSLGYSETLFSRLFIILIIITGLIYLVMFYASRKKVQLRLKETANSFLYAYALIAFVFLSVSFIGAIAGAVMLAEFFTYAIIKSASLIIIIYALILTVNSILYTMIYGSAMQKLNLIAQYKNLIFSRLSSLVIAMGWVLWTIFTLRLFNIWDDVWNILKDIFTKSFTIGNSDFSFGNIVLFIVILIITIWISRLAKIVIEGELAPRVKMKRGVPGALALLLRIGIITIGFLFAAGAAGLGMDNITILLGALGVGIGFGLQNIFNNLVSGIILAFERPIQEGDIIEVGELWGTVKEIGIRASTIFTFDGAEVIVPNGNLISNELINWTLTDRNRRVEVTIGVAYGTDPDKVLEILRDISSSHKDIMKEPAPLSLFTGFGDSSLDFRLLFWIPQADNRFVIQSEVNVAINAALREAGIEIPFPQRDVHIKSGAI